jgi:hypothetical protein
MGHAEHNISTMISIQILGRSCQGQGLLGETAGGRPCHLAAGGAPPVAAALRSDPQQLVLSISLAITLALVGDPAGVCVPTRRTHGGG